MNTFNHHYQSLNPAQRQAVDTIDGPVMVVAGPGVGKTQLLSMRVANIVRSTDTLPGNILCLTFTDSGATAMRQRLVSLMGQEGYKVAVHTFHSFGTEVLNRHPEYFYQGANFRASDELSSFEILEPIFKALPQNDPLASSINGQFAALGDVRQAIGHLKKAGLTPDELRKILDYNDQYMAASEPILAAAFDVPRLSKKDIPAVERAYEQLSKLAVAPSPIAQFKPLAEICLHELAHALAAATEQSSTTPLTAWRVAWLERDDKKDYIFKDRARSKKLRSLAAVYEKYLLAMQESSLFDFDDMILRVVHALESFPAFRYNLQEQYFYVLVDEFQDTNGAQLRLLHNLLDSEAANGQPNIMVVGDDDQAIYAFQGAEIGNLLQFNEPFRDPAVITLTENYRSTDTILASARSVIVQGEDRLETTLGINKQLTARNTHADTLSQRHHFANPTSQYAWVAQEIVHQLKAGARAEEIAVLARNHRQLLDILPFLHQAELQVDYERRNNVLEAEPIRVLISLAQTITAIGEQRFDLVDTLLPELLSYDLWGIDATSLWQISLDAYKRRRFWLEVMLERDDKLHDIAEFLIVTSHNALHQPLEQVLDQLIGSAERQVPSSDEVDTPDGNHHEHEGFVSPFRAYYFNGGRLESDPTDYLANLNSLALIRRKLRDWRPDATLLLDDFVAFIELHHKTNTPIVDIGQQHEGFQAIKLLSAHKAKGLEFDTVFILSCQDNIWGPSARHPSSQVSFPRNLAITPTTLTGDDCLRLFYVAMTRARHQLYLCGYQTDGNDKPSLPLAYLTNQTDPVVDHDGFKPELLTASLEPTWQLRHLRKVAATDRLALLQPRLAGYQLSATHLNNFIDITTGGPQAFLLQNLLRFPQALSPGAAFGSAIHRVLQRAHVHLSVTGERRPVEDILHDFELQLGQARLDEDDFLRQLEKGSQVLESFLKHRYDSFHPDQKVEYTLRDIPLGDARLTGTLDLLEIDPVTRTITLTDYKTGKPATSWQGATDYEKIKLHKYRQQLMFYKLLIDNSRDFGGSHRIERAILEFVEPDSGGELHQLEMQYDADELVQFSHLIAGTWQYIMELHLPSIKDYESSYKGVVQFERDIIATKTNRTQ